MNISHLFDNVFIAQSPPPLLLSRTTVQRGHIDLHKYQALLYEFLLPNIFITLAQFREFVFLLRM